MKKTVHRKGCGGRRDGGREDTPATGKAQGTFREQRRFSVVETQDLGRQKGETEGWNNELGLCCMGIGTLALRMFIFNLANSGKTIKSLCKGKG